MIYPISAELISRPSEKLQRACAKTSHQLGKAQEEMTMNFDAIDKLCKRSRHKVLPCTPQFRALIHPLPAVLVVAARRM